MANGMGGLYVGVSGLQSAQNAINTTAHNISNVNTTGYTRQQVVFDDTGYHNIGMNAVGRLKTGLGVDIQEVRRCRDEFLDKAYRQEKGRQGFYESQYEVYAEIESQFGELQGVNFQAIMSDLKSSMTELALSPTSNVARAALVQSSVAFVDRANEIYNSLCKYQKTLNTKVGEIVDRINELGYTIDKLNNDILRIENNGERANDLRDERDSALDELGALVKMEYFQMDNGTIEVMIEGNLFVSDSGILTMDVETIEGTDLYKPVWNYMDKKDVFTLNLEISSEKNNDIGELKGLLLARGDGIPNYTVVDGDLEYYQRYIEPSAIMKTIAGFDKLINKMVTDINDILCPDETTQRTITTANGIEVTGTFLDMEKTSYGMDENKSVGVELFSRNYTDRYIEITGADGVTYYMRNDRNSFGNESLYRLGNISVNDDVLENYGRIPLTHKNGEEAFDKTEAMLDKWDDAQMVFDPSTAAQETYAGYYNAFIYDIGNTGGMCSNMVDSQVSMANGLDNRRQEVAGVSSDEELTNMIKFQNAYNASSRYITVVSEMLEHLINRLGV